MKKTLAILLCLLLVIPCFSVFVGAENLVNVAQGKKYTVDLCGGTPNYGSPDPDDGTGFGDGINLARQRLTDGVLGKADEGGAGGLIGAQNTAKAIYTIDLGAVVDNIKKFNMDMYYGAWGIAEGLSVEYAYSTDGTTYTTAGKVERANAVDKSAEGSWQGHDYVLSLTDGVSARYIKITAEGTNYIWSTEMQVFAVGTGPQTGSNETEIVIFAVFAIALSAAYVFSSMKKRTVE